jgi:hypothetical protein
MPNRSPYLKFIVMLLLSLGLSSCAYIQENLKDPPPPPEKEVVLSERELLFNEAEKNYKSGLYEPALQQYLRIARDPSDGADPLYEKTILGMAKIYEKTGQSEKAVLAFSELQRMNSTVISDTSLKMSLIKNHFRVSNYYQAKTIKTEIDSDYKEQKINLSDLFQAIYYETDMYFDGEILNELLFLGEIQKYFIYVIESDRADDSEKATDLLILNYNKFLTKLDSPVFSADLKKKLIISLIEQLNKFDRYRMEGSKNNLSNFNRISNFASTTQRNLTERLTNGKL